MSDSFKTEFYQTFKEVVGNAILLKLLHKIETGVLSFSFNEVTVTLILKPYKDSTKKENYR